MSLLRYSASLPAWRRDAGMEGGVINAGIAVYDEGSGDIGAIIMGRFACPSSCARTTPACRSNAAAARRSPS